MTARDEINWAYLKSISLRRDQDAKTLHGNGCARTSGIFLRRFGSMSVGVRDYAQRRLRRASMRVTLLAGVERNGQAVLLGRHGAGGIGRVGAGRIVELVEVEDECAGLGETVAGQAGGEKARRLVGGGLTGGVAQDEKQLVVFAALDDGFETHGFAVEGELGDAGSGQVESCSDDGGNLFDVQRSEGNPSRRYVIARVGRVPVEPMKAGAGGRVGVFGAQRITAASGQHHHGE